MKALTLWQPWASLIALGEKRIETRSWSTTYRGPLVIHAAMRYPTDRDMYRHGAYTHIKDRIGPFNFKPGMIIGQPDLPLGAIVATGELVDVVPIAKNAPSRLTAGKVVLVPGHGQDRHLWLDNGVGRRLARQGTGERAFGDYTPGRYAWLLDNIVPLDSPIPIKGSQGLWTLPDPVAAGLLGLPDQEGQARVRRG